MVFGKGHEKKPLWIPAYSILWSDWPTSKRKVSRHGIVLPLRFADAKGEKRRLEMRLLFAGYRFSRLLKFFRKIILLSYPVKTEIVVDRKNFSDESSLLGNIMCYVFSPHQHYIETPYKMNQTFKWISKNKKNDVIVNTVRSDDLKVLKSSWNVV